MSIPVKHTIQTIKKGALTIKLRRTRYALKRVTTLLSIIARVLFPTGII